MRPIHYAFALLAAAGIACAHDALPAIPEVHQTADQDGIYYVGPEISIPKMVSTVSVPYPYNVAAKDIQGMTVMAMVIDAKGLPQHLQVLHSHGAEFDRASLGAVQASKFEPALLSGKPVPVWIDVRVAFTANRTSAVPQILITERDLPAPDAAQFEDKHHKPLSYTPPYPIHTVDADFTDPYAKHPFVEVATVSVLVGVDGLPKDAYVRRGLGFGLDEKAKAAVMHYKFFPATKKGTPIEARRDVMVDFAKF
jgi:TonB family protein